MNHGMEFFEDGVMVLIPRYSVFCWIGITAMNRSRNECSKICCYSKPLCLSRSISQCLQIRLLKAKVNNPTSSTSSL
jgi:hypothetical protein